jgi:hypothetical protein
VQRLLVRLIIEWTFSPLDCYSIQIFPKVGHGFLGSFYNLSRIWRVFFNSL